MGHSKTTRIREERDCKHHGKTLFVQTSKLKSGKYSFRCCKCRVDAVVKRRKTTKQKAVDYKGNKCEDCSLKSEYIEVYDFHHKDPTEKDFGIAKKGNCRAWENVKKELDKCVMLCANCHRVRHAKEKEDK